jgi:hypothetical protein
MQDIQDEFGGEEYILPPELFRQAQRLRWQNKWSLQEIADKLQVHVENLRHGMDLRQREIEGEDD